MIFSLEQAPADQMAFLTNTKTISYGELRTKIAEVGSAFSQRCLMFVLCKNEPGAVIGYLAALEYGVVPLLLDADLEPERLQSLMDRYHPFYLWKKAEEKSLVQCEGYGLYATGYQAFEIHDQIALMLATSGSTGDGKLVKISRNNLESNAASIAEYLKLSEKERPITTLPMHYTYGLSIINSHLYVGGSILMTTGSVVQQEFWELFEKGCATSFGGVPYTYQLLKRLRFFRGGCEHLTSLTQAGGHLPEQLQQEVAAWARKNRIRFYVMYGQTEATARMSYLPYDRCEEKNGSIGIPIPGGEFQLRDEKDQILTEPGQVGELVYQGPNVTLGYVEKIEDFAIGDERKGVLKTGDMARRDSEGFYYIVGRKSRFLKLFGNRVSLDGCEKLLTEQFGENGSIEFVCTGEDDRLCICVTDPQADPEQIRNWLADALHLSPKAILVYHMSEIPRTGSGKVNYAELKKITLSVGEK